MASVDNWEDDFKATDKGEGRTAVKSVFEYLDPLNYIGGGKRGIGMDAIGNMFGENYKGNISWHNSEYDKDVYSQMDAPQWEELSKLTGTAQRNWIERRAGELKRGEGRPRGRFQSHANIGQEQGADPNSPESLAAAAQAKNEAAFQKWRAEIMQQLDVFSKEMGMPVEELIKRGDLGVMNAGANAQSQAGAAAYGAGLSGGGVSSMNTQRAVTDAQSKYQLQRAGLGLNATNSLLSNMGQMAHEGEDIRRYEQGMNMQMQQANEQMRQRQFAEGQGKQAGLFGLAGGVIGGIYGGPTGAAFGSQLGQGLGGQSYGTYKPRAMTYPSGSTRQGSGLGGGRNPFGGSQ